MLQKTNLPGQVRNYLLDQIKKDHLQPDEVISLAALSRKLGISVTPIREALNQLSRSGFIEAVPNRGFVLKALDLREALEIYPIISTLEGMALSKAFYEEKEIQKLRDTNQGFKNTKTIREAVLADNEFHDQLIKPLKNESLQRLISDLKVRILIYEFRFQNDQSLFAQSAEEHEELIFSIEKGGRDTAQKLLRHHWERSMLFIEKKMKS